MLLRDRTHLVLAVVVMSSSAARVAAQPDVPGFVTFLVAPITTVTSSPAFTLAPFGTPIVRVTPPWPVRVVAAVAEPPDAATVTSDVVSPVVSVPAGRSTMMVEVCVDVSRSALVVNVTV